MADNLLTSKRAYASHTYSLLSVIPEMYVSTVDDQGAVVCRIDDMIVAAVISLQHPMGSGADEICAWIEVHTVPHLLFGGICGDDCFENYSEALVARTVMLTI